MLPGTLKTNCSSEVAVLNHLDFAVLCNSMCTVTDINLFANNPTKGFWETKFDYSTNIIWYFKIRPEVASFKLACSYHEILHL